MKRFRSVVICSLLALLVFSFGPLTPLSPVRPAAAQGIWHPCSILNDPWFDALSINGETGIQALAGETITVTVNEAAFSGQEMELGVDLFTPPSTFTPVFFEWREAPGTLSFTFPADGTYALWWRVQGENPETDAVVWTVSGTCGRPASVPAPVASGPVPGPDLCSMPAGSVVGTFPVEVLLYYAPKEGAVSTVKMKAGQSLWVTGMDKTQSFYQVLLVCQKLWIPASEIGPTPGYPWYGKMLPMTIIE